MSSERPLRSPFAYRTAKPRDAAALIILEVQAQVGRKGPGIPIRPLHPSGVTYIKKLLRKPETWSQLAFDHSELVGQIYGYPSSDSHSPDKASTTHHIASLMVDPERRREGIGNSLLDLAIQSLPQLGASAVDLWVNSENLPAQALYQRHGFRPTGEGRTHPQQNDSQLRYLLELPR